MALRTKIETGNYYNLVMDVDSYSRTNKSIKKRGIFKDRYLCVRMRIDGGPGIGLETERMSWLLSAN